MSGSGSHPLRVGGGCLRDVATTVRTPFRRVSSTTLCPTSGRCRRT